MSALRSLALLGLVLGCTRDPTPAPLSGAAAPAGEDHFVARALAEPQTLTDDELRERLRPERAPAEQLAALRLLLSRGRGLSAVAVLARAVSTQAAVRAAALVGLARLDQVEAKALLDDYRRSASPELREELARLEALGR